MVTKTPISEQYTTIIHPYEAVYDENSRVLILGTMASVKSRENGFFYGHPHNRFWQVIAAITHSSPPITIAEKRSMLIDNKIALWDVLHSCEIKGSSDSSIRNPQVNDFSEIIEKSNITHIFTNGKTSDKLYRQYCEGKTKIQSICLPSTSPANAAWNVERLIAQWAIIQKYIEDEK